MNEVVRTAFVVILTWLFQLLAHAIGLEIDEATLYTLAGVIVVFILSKLGVPFVRLLIPRSRLYLRDERDE